MTRTVVILVCFLLNLISVSPLLERRSEQGRLNCVSYSEPVFRSASTSPFFLNWQPFLNVVFDEAPLKPRTDAIYTPEPIEITDTSPILHKLNKLIKDLTEDEEETQGYLTQESSEEESPIEYDHEVTHCCQSEIDEREDIIDNTSSEECVEITDNTSSEEEHGGNTSEEDTDISAEENEMNRGSICIYIV